MPDLYANFKVVINLKAMKEFMLLIRNEAESKLHFSAEEDTRFLKACEV